MLEVTEEERQRAIQRSRRMYETDLVSDVLATHRERWYENFAKRMHIMGFNEADIVRATDLSEQNVNDILTGVTEERRKLELQRCLQVKQELILQGCDPNTGAAEEVSRVLTAYGEDHLKRIKGEVMHLMYKNGFEIADIAKAFLLSKQEVNDILAT
ncbi:hypothetical protein R80B4_02194 [Fibrobacteres bacterium R8-0-B4]